MSQLSLHDAIIVMPALNEADVIASLVTAVAGLGVREIVVVDDCSSDQTARAAEAVGATVITLSEPLGAWGATQTGLRYAVRKGAKLVITMDADGQHLPSTLEALVRPIAEGTANVTIGCYPERASLARRVAWRWIKRTSGLSFSDVTSGLRAYDRWALRRLASWAATLIDYQDVGILLLLLQHDLAIADVPVSMNRRRNGKSRIFRSWSVVGYYMVHTLLLGLVKRPRHWRRVNPTVAVGDRR